MKMVSFEQQKELLDYEHQLKLKEIDAKLKMNLDIERVKFEQQKELQRIKEAGIRRSLDRKGDRNFADNYWKNENSSRS
jgi:hypothetical protein